MIQALIFDVFGTCVDWRSSVARAVSEQLPAADPTLFAEAWRGEYDPAMARIRDGNRGYVALDILHRENLDRVCANLGLTCDAPDRLTRAWEALDPWPDVIEGLHAMRAHALVAPCSNGSIAMMARLARYAGLPWDCILGAEIAQDYKPAPAVYRAACAALQLDPSNVVMVAAHNGDLAAARAEGLKTAFVVRPTEYGPMQETDLDPEGDWDYVAGDFIALAREIWPDP